MRFSPALRRRRDGRRRPCGCKRHLLCFFDRASLTQAFCVTPECRKQHTFKRSMFSVGRGSNGTAVQRICPAVFLPHVTLPSSPPQGCLGAFSVEIPAILTLYCSGSSPRDPRPVHHQVGGHGLNTPCVCRLGCFVRSFWKWGSRRGFTGHKQAQRMSQRSHPACCQQLCPQPWPLLAAGLVPCPPKPLETHGRTSRGVLGAPCPAASPAAAGAPAAGAGAADRARRW